MSTTKNKFLSDLDHMLVMSSSLLLFSFVLYLHGKYENKENRNIKCLNDGIINEIQMFDNLSPIAYLQNGEVLFLVED